MEARNRDIGIECREVGAAETKAKFRKSSYIDATSAILVTKGSARIAVNSTLRHAEKGDIILLSISHTVTPESLSEDFSAIFLVVNEHFMSHMDATDMIYRRIKYGALLYNNPVQQLTDSATLEERLRDIAHSVADTGHTYYKEVILNSLNRFYLDLSDAIERQRIEKTEFPTRHGSIVKSFVELLAANYLAEHKVSFYSSRLNISDHHLTLIVKRVTGRSPSDFIYGMLYSHARSLLATSRLSVQEIAARLNFSDQSSFGKFFRRRSGFTPHDYRTLSESE